ncbi:hypothetical protein ACFELO_07825 [Oceanicaulis sp. LC35]|uniref:hypothetical protein n=1 Tax=Oceanicaulis sp. LC35 TaxID=3349635 RepID=UPI003F87185A
MTLTGECHTPDQSRTLLYQIDQPSESDIAPFECHVRLTDKANGDILVDNPVFGEDSFQALHCATMLIHTLSGWKAKMDEAIIDSGKL